MDITNFSARCQALVQGQPDQAAKLMIRELFSDGWQVDHIAEAVNDMMAKHGHAAVVMVTPHMVKDIVAASGLVCSASRPNQELVQAL